MSYKVQFLDDESFERLPGTNMQTKIGVAYPEYGYAFVRKSGSGAIDIFNMAHELEHLKGDALNEHYDAENKCYYKDAGNFFKPVLQMASAFLPPPFNIMGEAGSSLLPNMGQNPKQPAQGDQPQPMDQFQAPQIQNTPNQIAGASGIGSAGGPGAAPGGGVGGGIVNKLKPQIEANNMGAAVGMQ